jgi:Protein of unknown function (DUF2950)
MEGAAAGKPLVRIAMATTIHYSKTKSHERPLRPLVPALCALFSACLALPALAQQPGQKTFRTPAEACNSLYTAVQNNDEAAVEAILGKDVLSPDKEAARLARHQFTEKYQQMHRLVKEPEGITALYVGAENWPFPVPLVDKNGKWYFDSQAGKEEIMFRRIGENEITALEVCDRFIADKKQAARKAAAAGDPMDQYAATLVSNSAAQQPFHGYRFRTVSGGSLALVAYPAEYRNSGVKTFIVTADGMVFEKDMGANTAQAAQQLNQRPASGWSSAQ